MVIGLWYGLRHTTAQPLLCKTEGASALHRAWYFGDLKGCNMNTGRRFSVLFLVFLLALVPLGGATCNSHFKGRESATLPPVVIQVTPANFSVGITINQTMTALFSKSLDPLTVSTATFLVNQGTSAVAGSVTYAYPTATFTPSTNLIPNTLYSVRITTGVHDLSGQAMAADFLWSFTTGSASGGPAPTVIAISPADLAMDVPVNTDIAVTFSAAMNPLTIDTSTFQVKKGTTTITGTVFAANNTAIFSPTGDLDANGDFQVTITAGVEDTGGHALAGNYLWSFSTGSDSDTSPPTISMVNPANNATAVALNFDVTASFSEAMNPLTLTTTSFSIAEGSTSIGGTVTCDGNLATFSPAVPFTGNAVYTATMTSAVSDLAGNTMVAPFSWSFTTGPGSGALSTVVLGEAAHFAILAGASISTVASSVITGDVGLSPGNEFLITGFAQTDTAGSATSGQVTGLIYAADMAAPTPAMLASAQNDLTLAYTDAEGRSPAPTGLFFNPGAGDLAGLDLAPGLYQCTGNVGATAAFTLTGTATDIWIFQLTSDLNVSNGVHVTLNGGALAKNIFWQVGAQATFGQNVIFHGTVLANTSITLNRNTTLNGRALARSGSVTSDQSTVTVPGP